MDRGRGLGEVKGGGVAQKSRSGEKIVKYPDFVFFENENTRKHADA